MPTSLTPKNSDVRSYQALFRKVKATLLEGQRNIEQQKVFTYWETGRLVQTHILQNKDRAAYGAEVVARLAEDLEVEITTFRRCIQFYKAYPDFKKVGARREFKWKHYQRLIAVHDPRERAKFEELARKNDLSYRELAARIKSGRAAADAEVSETIHYPLSTIHSTDPLIPLRGQLYTYQIFKRKVLSAGTSELVLDLGFSNYRDVEPLDKYSAGDIVESIRKNAVEQGTAGSRQLAAGKTPGTNGPTPAACCPLPAAYKLTRISGHTAKDLYTYNALVEKVVDGDTLKAHIDLGFGMWTRQTLRLRGIDCPEVNTKDGDAAKAFVQSYLKEADQIVIRSSKSDKYDRYLADIYIPQAEGAEDIFLNNLLLEKGHAERHE